RDEGCSAGNRGGILSVRRRRTKRTGTSTRAGSPAVSAEISYSASTPRANHSAACALVLDALERALQLVRVPGGARALQLHDDRGDQRRTPRMLGHTLRITYSGHPPA